jgi:hypothetical protein
MASSPSHTGAFLPPLGATLTHVFRRAFLSVCCHYYGEFGIETSPDFRQTLACPTCSAQVSRSFKSALIFRAKPVSFHVSSGLLIVMFIHHRRTTTGLAYSLLREYQLSLLWERQLSLCGNINYPVSKKKCCGLPISPWYVITSTVSDTEFHRRHIWWH